MGERNIYQRVNAVMNKITYVQKDKQVDAPGQKYKAVTHDNVTAQIRKHLVGEGIVIHLEQLKGEILIKRDVKSDVKMHLYSGDYAISFVNIDNPEDRITVTINAHASDNGDKAPGKCASYATKYAMLKVFSIETGDNEESRTYEAPLFTDLQKSEFNELIETENALGFLAFTQSVGPDVCTALFNSFEPGNKTAGKKRFRELETKGWEVAQEYTQQIRDAISKEDPSLGRLIDELAPTERKIVAKGLNQTEIEYLRSFNNAA